MVAAGAMAAAWLACAPAAAEAATLDRVRDTGTFRIGYRADAKPYSFRNENGQPAGYIVDLCIEVAAAVRAEVGDQYPGGVRAGARGPTLRVGARRQGRRSLRSELGDHAAPRAGRLLAADISRRRQRAVPDEQAGEPFRGHRQPARRRAGRHHHRAGAARDRWASSASRQRSFRSATTAPASIFCPSDKIDAYFADRAIIAAILNEGGRPGFQLSKQYFSIGNLCARAAARRRRVPAAGRPHAGAALPQRPDQRHPRQDIRPGLPDDMLKAMILINSLPDK